MSRTLFSLQGYIRIGKRLANGKPGPMFWAGNVPEATLELAVENANKNESFSGNRFPYGKRKTSQTGRFTGTMDEWSTQNLALGLYTSSLNTVTGSVTAEAFPTDLAIGDQIRLAHPYASSLVITDSTPGTPLTVNPDHYDLVGHNASIVEISNLAAYVEPLNAAYTHAAYDSLEVFSEQPEEVYVVFDGINTETGEGVLIDMYRTSFDPFGSIGMINAEYGSLPFTSDVLYDPLNLNAQGKGGFARIRQKSTTP